MISNLFLAATTAATNVKGESAPWWYQYSSILMLVFIFVIMYFLLIRPQRKREKEEQKMRNDLRVGDEIVTIGGIICRVINVKEDLILVETGADRTKLSLKKWAVQSNNTVHEAAAIDDDDDDDFDEDDDI